MGNGNTVNKMGQLLLVGGAGHSNLPGLEADYGSPPRCHTQPIKGLWMLRLVRRFFLYTRLFCLLCPQALGEL